MRHHLIPLPLLLSLVCAAGCEASPAASGAASAQPTTSADAPTELTVSKPKEVAATADADLGTMPEGIGLAVGTEAPDFELPGLDGKKVRLHALLDQSKVLLVFYRGGW